MKNCKKIIYFSDFPLWIGGANKVLLTQAHIMQQKGYQVKVVIPNDKVGKHTKEYDRICAEYELESLTAYYTVAVCMEEIDIIAALEQYQAIVMLLKESRPDIIHSTQLNIAVELAARELGIPHLMNIYQVDRQAFNVHWMNVYPQYHSADSVLMSNRWSEGLGIESKCIRVAYSSKNEANSALEKGVEICALSIGDVCERKNQLESIKFIADCRKKGYCIRLIILGYDQGIYADRCKKYVEENELQSNVQFVGFVSCVEKYLENADLLVVASTVESYPGVIVESMANRVPIISTPVAGVPELLENGKNGFLTGGYKAKDLYKAFSTFVKYQESGQIIQVIENAYETYLEKHTYESVGNELEKYYQWIVNDYPGKDTYLTAVHVRQKVDVFRHGRRMDSISVESNKIWFWYHILPIIEQKDNRMTVIWGAGLWGKKVFDWLRDLHSQIEFVGFVDSFKEGEYLGFPIISGKDSLVGECGTIIVAIADEMSRLKIMDYLDAQGKERNRDYFLIWNGPVRL